MTTQQKECLTLLVYCFVKFNKWEQAQEGLNFLIEHYAKDLNVLQLSSYTHLNMNNSRLALRDADKALDYSKTPSSLATSHLLRSKALWQIGKKEQARESLDIFFQHQNAFLSQSRASIDHQIAQG